MCTWYVIEELVGQYYLSSQLNQSDFGLSAGAER